MSVNESAETDLRALSVAERWMYRFAAWMEQHNSTTPLGEIDEMIYASIPTKHGRLHTMMLSGWRIDLPNDLSVGFGWTDEPNETRGHLIAGIQEGRRHYWLVLTVPRDPRQNVDVIWSTNLSSFRHEAIHYLDHKRGYDRVIYRRQMRGGRVVADQSVEQYYNDDLELNAHFQQALGDIFTALASNIAQKEVYDRADDVSWLASFEAFLRQFIKIADRQKYQYLQHISAPNKQKLIRRLYKVYTLIQRGWPDLPEIRQQADDFIAKWRAQDAA